MKTSSCSHPWISELAPSLFLQVIPPTFNDSELAAFVAALEVLVGSQRAPFAWVVMADAILSTSARQRKMMADADARMQPQDKKFCAGTAIVLTSSVARGVVTAVYWLTPPVYPYVICPTEAAGRAWAQARLSERR